jgi:hypothetical protein
MKRISAIEIAIGAFFTVSSVLPVSALPTTSEPAKSLSQIEQAQVTIKYKTWRGHRGYRYKRPGYRRQVDGFWYPQAAFTVRVAPGVRVKVGPRHARWCRGQYRSYRVSDNTFVVRGGVRRVCRSPY